MLKIYSDPKSFWNEVSPHLKKEEAKNSLCLGLAHTFLSDNKNCVFQAAIVKDGKFQAAVLVSKYLSNQNLVASPLKDKTIAREFLEVLEKNKITFNGVVSEAETAKIYRDLIHEKGQQTKTNMAQGIYRCLKTKMPDFESNIIFRAATELDIPTLKVWIEEFHHEAVPHDPKIDSEEIAKAKVKSGMVYVIEKDKNLLSMACWGRDIGSSCSVNLVYTPKPLRKKGYASIATGLLTKKILDEGKAETNLYTDMTNPTSNKIYQDIGYEFVCNSMHIGVL